MVHIRNAFCRGERIKLPFWYSYRAITVSLIQKLIQNYANAWLSKANLSRSLSFDTLKLDA